MKLPRDTEIWLFAFEVVGSLTVVLVGAAAMDLTRLYHWMKSMYGGQI